MVSWSLMLSNCKLTIMEGLFYNMATLVAQMIKNLPVIWETQDQSLGWEDPLEKEMATHSATLVLLPGRFHGLRSLVGYSPWGRKESHMTK